MSSSKFFHASIVLLGLLFVLAIAVTAYFSLGSRQNITTFEECAAAGNPVMESYPRQCRADGALFVEDIDGTLLSPAEEAPRDEIGDIHAPIQNEFENKIIYGVDSALDEALVRDHCEKRGGTFNTCGSPCAEGEICIEVCALTCEFQTP